MDLSLRGTPTGYEDDVDPEVTCLLGGKQLAMAAYWVMEHHPTNANVIKLRAEGYTVLMRSNTMATYVKSFIVKQHNSKHGGCSTTYPELLNQAFKCSIVVLSRKQFRNQVACL